MKPTQYQLLSKLCFVLGFVAAFFELPAVFAPDNAPLAGGAFVGADLGASGMPVLVLAEVVQEAELSQSAEAPDLAMPVIAMPVLGMPETVVPSDQPVAIEV
jgi:hypothetical protein